MATTSPDNIWTPDSGDDYALTVDLAAMADTVQDALSALPLVQRGEISFEGDGVSTVSTGVTFPTPFGSTPTVVIDNRILLGGQSLVTGASDESPTGFKGNMVLSGPGTSGPGFSGTWGTQWIAIGDRP